MKVQKRLQVRVHEGWDPSSIKFMVAKFVVIKFMVLKFMK